MIIPVYIEKKNIKFSEIITVQTLEDWYCKTMNRYNKSLEHWEKDFQIDYTVFNTC